jgi:hypothetical protein
VVILCDAKQAASMPRDHEFLLRVHNPGGNTAAGTANVRSTRSVGLLIQIEAHSNWRQSIFERESESRFRQCPP